MTELKLGGLIRPFISSAAGATIMTFETDSYRPFMAAAILPDTASAASRSGSVAFPQFAHQHARAAAQKCRVSSSVMRWRRSA